MNAKQEIKKIADNEHKFKLLTEEDINIIKLKERRETAKEIFDEIERTFEKIIGCSNPFCQNYPEKEIVWDELKKQFLEKDKR